MAVKQHQLSFWLNGSWVSRSADGITSLDFGLGRLQLKDAFPFGYIFKGTSRCPGGPSFGECILEIRKSKLTGYEEMD